MLSLGWTTSRLNLLCTIGLPGGLTACERKGRTQSEKQSKRVNNGLNCEIQWGFPVDGVVWEWAFIHYSLLDLLILCCILMAAHIALNYREITTMRTMFLCYLKLPTLVWELKYSGSSSPSPTCRFSVHNTCSWMHRGPGDPSLGSFGVLHTVGVNGDIPVAPWEFVNSCLLSFTKQI